MRRLLSAACAVLIAASARAAAVTWTGGASGDWNVAANWSPASVPGALDAVTIPSGTVVAYSTDPALGVASLTLGAAGVTPAAVLQLSTGLAVGGTLLLTDGAALQVATAAAVSGVDITLLNGTSIAFTVAPALAAPAPFLRLYASGSFTLAGGSTIAARGRGYAAGELSSAGAGAGAGGAGSAAAGGGGGGHGGPGGNGGAAANAGAAFDVFLPAEPGAGGGGAASSRGGAGGGGVLIVASTAALDGLIDADGDPGVSAGFEGGGGGGGGAVVVDAAVMRGTGTVSAQGGDGGAGASFGGGGGGGGRLWVREREYATIGSTLTLRVSGGSGAGFGSFGAAGTAGTIHLDPLHWTGAAGDTLASNPANWRGGPTPHGGERLVFGASETAKAAVWNMGVSPSSASLLPAFSSTVVLASSLTVTGSFEMGGGTLTAPAGVALRVDGGVDQTGGRMDLSASTIAVAASGGSVAVRFFDAGARLFVVGGAAPATATVSGFLTVGSSATVNSLAELDLATGTLTHNGNGPFLGAGGVRASTGHWTVSGGSTQTWTAFNGYIGSLRVTNPNASGLTLSTAAGSSFSLTGGLTVDPAAVLRATGAALGVGGDWNVLGTAYLSGSTVTFAPPAGSTLTVAAGASFQELAIGGPGGVRLSTAVTVASSVTVTGGALDLAGATVSVRGWWTQTGGAVLGAQSRIVFDGLLPQRITALSGSSFGAFVSSNTAGVTIGSPLTVNAQVEWRRGPLDFAGRALAVGGDMLITFGAVLNYAGSTVTFNGTSTQTINFTTLDNVVVDNPSPVRLGANSSWGSFTINPGRYFDGGVRQLTIGGSRWSTAGAVYGSIPQFHTVIWSPTAASSITVAAGSVVNAKVVITTGAAAVLEGGLIIDGAGNALEPKAGSTVINAAGGSTITFRGSSDLSASAGANWTYGGDAANSWLVFEGTGSSRGAAISTNAFGSILVAIDANSVFSPPPLNLTGSLVISSGTVRPGGAKTIALGGDLLQIGGALDFGATSTGTLILNGGSTQTLSLLPGSTLWNLVAEGTGTVNAASFLRVRGDFTVNAGVFRAGSSSHSFQQNFTIGPGGYFDGQSSTVTLDGGAIGRSSQAVSFLGGGAFWGLSQAVSSVTFLTSATAQYLTDAVPGSTIAVAGGATLRVGEFSMGAPTGTPLRLRSTAPGVPWFLRVVTASSVTLTGVSDSDASPGLRVNADDGRCVDQGGNSNWNFKPGLLVLLPGETFTPGVAPGKTGAPSISTAGVPVTVTVRAVSSRFDPVTTATETVTLATDDPATAAPAPLALVLGTTAFTLTPRGAEPSPRTTFVTASAAFASGVSTLTVVPDALSRLQIILPGEAAAPGTATGKTGGASARVKGIPFSATVRAVDAYWNLISTVTDTAALSISASSAALPASQALSGGQRTFTGLVVYATGSFTLSATDLTQPGVTAATSAVFGVSPPSLTSPTLGGYVPNGSRVATLGGGVSGFAEDGSAVERVLVDLRDLDGALHFDWSAQSFSLASPSYATATLGSPLTQGTTWFRAASDAAFVDGRRFRLTMLANNPTGLETVATSTFTFDRGMLSFGARDGQGSASVTPASAAGCEEIVSTVTLTVGASGIGPGGAVAVRAPEGWTLPLGVSASSTPPLGYWHAASTSLATSMGSTSAVVNPAYSGSVPLGPGWMLLSVATGSAQSFLAGQTMRFVYRARPPFGPAGRGPQSFSVMTRGDASGTLQAVSTSPVLTLGAGTTSFLAFADPAPLSLSPLTASATMQLAVVDMCGNSKPAASSGTVTLSLAVLGASGAVPDASAQFFSASGAAISTVVLVSGAASPSFAVWTSTDAPAELVLRATATFVGGAFSTTTVQATRSVRLRAALPAFAAVSVDTATLTPGATSVTLSAADPASSRAIIRFSFAEPELSWEALVSRDGVNFSSPVLAAVGLGDANRPISVGWDGLDRTRNPPVYPAEGSFKVRLRAAGGAAIDRRLEVVVPPTAGFAGRLGSRGAGALVRASGAGAGEGRWAVASSTGYFELRGLKPGLSYALSVDTAAVVLGRAVALSTSLAAGPAASPLTDLGALSLPATGHLRVSILIPSPSPREALGGFTARRPDGAAAFSGSLRLSSAAATSDDGGPLFGRSASTWSVVSAPAGLYDVDISIPELGLSTRAAGVAVPSGGGADLVVSMPKKAVVSGWVVLPSTVPYGAFVTVQARSSGATEPAAYGGFFVSSAPSVSGPSSGSYSLFGLDPGTWTVLARAPGFVAASTTVLVAGTADVSAATLTLGMGGRITGTATVAGDSRMTTQCFPAAGGAPGACPAGSYEIEVEALAGGRLDRAASRLRLGSHVTFASAAFTVAGLDAGTYTVRASLPGFRLVPAQGATVIVPAGGTAAADFTLAKVDARLRVDIAVPPLPGGACRSTSSYRSLGLLLEPDGAAPLVYGDATAMAPTVVASRAQVSTVTGAFMLLHCSSATAFTPALPPGGARASVLFATGGGFARGRATLVDGTTSVLSLDVSGATYAVTGTLSWSGVVAYSTPGAGGVTATVAVSSITGILNSAPNASFCVLGFGDPRTVPALRAELVPYDPVAVPLRRASGASAGLCAAPAASTAPAATAAFLAGIGPDGRFTFGGVSPGLYRLRVPGELDDIAANGPEAPDAEVLVAVGTAPVAASLRMSRGRRVSGRVSAPSGLASGRPLRVSLTDAEGRPIRSADVSCGADGVSYALDGIPDGRYRLDVSDLGTPAAWAARPSEVVVAGSDLDGRDAALVAAATVRARLALARPLPDGTEEHVLVSAENVHLLPRGFSARATAVPYAAGGAVSARPAADGSIVDAEGRVVFSGLLPGTYDVEFSGPDDSAPGAIAFAPARVSGVTVAAGQGADLGVVPVFWGATVSGLVSDAVTGLAVPGARVAARASLRSGVPELRRDGPSATADGSGRYVLRGLSPAVRWYDLTAGGPSHAAARVSSLDVSSGAAQSFVLAPAVSTVTGRVVSSDGTPLFSALGGAAAEAPGAALFLQRAGVPPADDPLADLSLRTEPDGAFTIPSLATGSYRLTVTASGQASLTRSVVLSGALADLGTLTLSGGGSVSGALRLPDGSPVPDDELRAVAAVTPDMTEFIYGSVVRDASARAAVSYKIGGLRAGRTYRVTALTPGEEASFPAEGLAVVLTSTAEARALDLTVRPPAPTVSARSRRAGSRTTVEFLFSRPLRSRLTADDDPSLAVSTVSAAGALSGARLSSDRRRLTVDYDAGVGESSFTLRASAATSALDYDSSSPSARELVATATAAFFTGETGSHRAVVSNAAGGVLVSEGDAGRVVLPRGAFSLDASSSVAVVFRRAPTAAGVSAASLPASLRAAAAALPASMPAYSDFYEISLPAGVPSTLSRPAQLTLVYSTAVADPSSLNLYWYNPGSGEYVLQPDALGGAAALDASARSLTVNVGHFSTFVLLASGAGAIGGSAHAGELEAYNFPNPFDLQVKTVTTIHGAGQQTVRGTMVRVGVPADLSGPGRLRVFDATGREVRSIDMGVLAAGQSHYQGWDGRNDAGQDVASGLYIGLVEIGSRRRSFKMAVIK